jgi:hypothetical protein
MSIVKIDEKKGYSLGEIVRYELIPGVDSIAKASRLVKNPIAGKVLKPKVVTRGSRGVQYRVTGANIEKYLLTQNEQKKN